MSEKAIGLIETKGFLATVESLDASLKAAEVKLLSRTFTTGGMVCLAVTGDVAAVKAAVDAGSAAARKLNGLVSTHVIPRPSGDVVTMIKTSKNVKNKAIRKKAKAGGKNMQNQLKGSENGKEELTDLLGVILKGTSAASLLVKGKPLEKYKVTELRKMLRALEMKGITGRAISKMKRQQILEIMDSYFRNNS